MIMIIILRYVLLFFDVLSTLRICSNISTYHNTNKNSNNNNVITYTTITTTTTTTTTSTATIHHIIRQY